MLAHPEKEVCGYILLKNRKKGPNWFYEYLNFNRKKTVLWFIIP